MSAPSPEPGRPGGPKPAWIRVRAGTGAACEATRLRLRRYGLHTVCEEALCPNRGRCWSHGRATVLILGKHCTRGCRFCNISRHAPQTPDPDEPARVAAAVRASGLREVEAHASQLKLSLLPRQGPTDLSGIR